MKLIIIPHLVSDDYVLKHMSKFCLVYGILTIVGYLMQNPLSTNTLDTYDS